MDTVGLRHQNERALATLAEAEEFNTEVSFLCQYISDGIEKAARFGFDKNKLEISLNTYSLRHIEAAVNEFNKSEDYKFSINTPINAYGLAYLTISWE
jgi:hypothetical protein